MKQVAKVCLAFLLITSLMFGQSSTGTRASTKKATAKANPVTTRLEQMEKAIEAQQDAQAAAAKSVPADQFDAVKKDVADLKDNSSGVALTLQETQKKIKEATESPLAIHYKGITITPGGFLAGETVYRNRALGADINTQLNGVNMPGAGQNRVSEFFG